MIIYNETEVAGQKVVTAFIDGELFTAGEDNVNYKNIVHLLHEMDEGLYLNRGELKDLFTPAVRVADNFRKLTDRVSLAGGVLYLDGDPVDNALTKQVIRFMEINVPAEKWTSLLNYFEEVQANPEPHSVEQLYGWVGSHDVTITSDGMLLAYKGVYSDGNGGWQSGQSGTAIVNGKTHTGRIPYAVGDEVEMPRSAVEHDPSTACAPGLHVGTYEYAKSWAQGAMLLVEVNPRDVVSVPTEAGGQKIRVCRFKIREVIDAPETAALSERDWDDEEYDYLGADDFDETEGLIWFKGVPDNYRNRV